MPAALLLAAALAVTGCTAGSDGGEGGKAAADRAEGPASGDQDNGGGKAGKGDQGAGNSGTSAARKASDPAGTHIIRTATLSVRVKDVQSALDTARKAAEDAGGVVGDESTDRDASGRERSRITLRVPQDAYADVLDELSGTGKLVSRKAKAKDVTDEVVDVESRVKTQRASVARVRDLMDDATKLADVVTLEDELSTRQAELDSLLARRASLEDRTTLSTITLSLSQPSPPVKKAEKDDDTGVGDALAGGWGAFVTFLRWVAVVIGAALPFLALGALLVLLWRLLRSRLPGADRRRIPWPAAPAHAPATIPTPTPAPGTGEGPDTGEKAPKSP
nr:DUF4349 domain-containing protein [Streptomyces triticagri]